MTNQTVSLGKYWKLFPTTSIHINSKNVSLRDSSNLARFHAFIIKVNNKHLMTGPEGNSEFCFFENPNVSLDFISGNIEIRGKQNLLFPKGPVRVICYITKQNKSKI